MPKLPRFLLLATALFATPVVIFSTAIAGPKFLKTGKALKPEMPISLQVRNQTSETVQIEIPSYTDQITIKPKERRRFKFKLRNNEHGLSVLYWTNQQKIGLQGKIVKPNSQTVNLDLYPSSYYDDDRAIYDTEIPGNVLVF
ncbi:hypothetical protein H6S82_05225 [Planktothrix sp. FACHB-1355]|uniref:Uncharacterized protein n=1 Tax=Aerosakkonema funiforme FACHB-1375 TaxID=2949571 RepID=A0A926VCN9_9CYAN|nr:MULTISPECIES: hypothetical protein [Oscillatoriales]MBD2181397.1 hypothetical protein [Aerosakkonema funiforme FACHB-1375]MBD3558257.1 hypothetical protein [Planktothrix sp. FACHB-1355]